MDYYDTDNRLNYYSRRFIYLLMIIIFFSLINLLRCVRIDACSPGELPWLPFLSLPAARFSGQVSHFSFTLFIFHAFIIIIFFFLQVSFSFHHVIFIFILDYWWHVTFTIIYCFIYCWWCCCFSCFIRIERFFFFCPHWIRETNYILSHWLDRWMMIDYWRQRERWIFFNIKYK